MKSISFLLAVAALVIVTSCNNESTGNNESNKMDHSDKEMKEMTTDSMNVNMDSTIRNNHP